MKAIKIAVAIAVSALSLTAYAAEGSDAVVASNAAPIVDKVGGFHDAQAAVTQQSVIGESIEGSFSSQTPVNASQVDGITGTGRGITGTGRGITGTGRGITGTGRGITGTGRGITGTGRGITGTGR